MPFHAGQTFLYPLGDATPTAHLWVIATEPNDEGLFAFVSFTSLKGAKDQTVILGKNDHPFLKWDTCIAYSVAEISDTDKLQGYIELGLARPHKDIRPEILAEIVAGFAASDFTRKRVCQFVKETRKTINRHST